MKNFSVFLVYFSIILCANAQLKIKDLNTHEPILNTKLFSKEGKILATSNLNGIIEQSYPNKVPKTDTVEVFHSNYYSKRIALNDLTDNPILFLKPDPITKMYEVTIIAKKPEYLVLKGSYVSYQIIDDIPVTFTDGVIEYYINLKKGKFIKSNIIKSRLYKNRKQINKLNAQKSNPTRNVLSTIAPFNFYEEVLLYDWNKFIISGDTLRTKKGKVIGHINNTENEESILSIQFHSPKDPKEVSLLGLKSKIFNKTINETFSDPNPKLKKITSISRYYNSDITKKDITIRYEFVQDFYVSEKKLMSKTQYINHINAKNNLDSTNDLNDSKIPTYIKSLLFKELKKI